MSDRTDVISKSKIDWISATFPFQTKMEDIVPNFLPQRVERVKSPIPVYPVALQHETGIKLLIGEQRLGVHVIYSGKTIDRLDSIDYTPLDIWSNVRKLKGKISRIDLAVDVINEPRFTPTQVYMEYIYGNCKTSLKSHKFVGSESAIETLYIGSMTSKTKKLRVYNKALESELFNKVWTRIELEVRKNANNTAMAVFSEQQSIKSMINLSVSFPDWQLWKQVMGEDRGYVPREIQTDTTLSDRIQNMLNTIPKQIANLYEQEMQTKNKLIEPDDSEVIKALQQALNTLIWSKYESFKQAGNTSDLSDWNTRLK